MPFVPFFSESDNGTSRVIAFGPPGQLPRFVEAFLSRELIWAFVEQARLKGSRASPSNTQPFFAAAQRFL